MIFCGKKSVKRRLYAKKISGKFWSEVLTVEKKCHVLQSLVSPHIRFPEKKLKILVYNDFRKIEFDPIRN